MPKINVLDPLSHHWLRESVGPGASSTCITWCGNASWSK